LYEVSILREGLRRWVVRRVNATGDGVSDTYSLYAELIAKCPLLELPPMLIGREVGKSEDVACICQCSSHLHGDEVGIRILYDMYTSAHKYIGYALRRTRSRPSIAARHSEGDLAARACRGARELAVHRHNSFCQWFC
ncbi:uncharacterized protein SCHCODRAFT_02207641, partial [Schizophyllum commune H4-8]|uniref:uncharacterized protein n=1 Tax=Schizophyllum commune (strain H4-8 / FGSC 9210) TaxID=578458 RepID=UPI00215E012C